MKRIKIHIVISLFFAFWRLEASNDSALLGLKACAYRLELLGALSLENPLQTFEAEIERDFGDKLKISFSDAFIQILSALRTGQLNMVLNDKHQVYIVEPRSINSSGLLNVFVDDEYRTSPVIILRNLFDPAPQNQKFFRERWQNLKPDTAMRIALEHELIHAAQLEKLPWGRFYYHAMAAKKIFQQIRMVNIDRQPQFQDQVVQIHAALTYLSDKLRGAKLLLEFQAMSFRAHPYIDREYLRKLWLRLIKNKELKDVEMNSILSEFQNHLRRNPIISENYSEILSNEARIEAIGWLRSLTDREPH